MTRFGNIYQPGKIIISVFQNQSTLLTIYHYHQNTQNYIY
jgi:hypothetical protein